MNIFTVNKFRMFLVAALVMQWGLLMAEESLPIGEFKLPPIKHVSGGEDYFPFNPKRERLQGRVLVEFGIGQDGASKDIRILNSEPSGAFDASALSTIKHTKFLVPSNWATTADGAHRFRVSVIYKLIPCPGSDPCAAPSKYQASDDVIVVTAEVWPRR